MFLAMLLSAASVAAHAQAGASHPLYVRPPVSQACPVGLSASRESAASFHSVEKTLGAHGQGVQINFTSPASRVIVKADILVHGVRTPGLREGLVLTERSQIHGSSTESLQVVGAADAPVLHPVVWTKSMTAINWLELTRIEYADGSVWEKSGESQCIVAPSLYLPVVDSAQ